MLFCSFFLFEKSRVSSNNENFSQQITYLNFEIEFYEETECQEKTLPVLGNEHGIMDHTETGIAFDCKQTQKATSQ